MTTAVTNTVVDHTTDAAFRTWVAEVIAQLIAAGLTQTADTGQINTATVTKPVAINTAAGYAIFRFNDTLQATAPIFFKLEFGTGTIVAGNPQMWLTVGTGSSGAGALTGLQTTRSALGPGTAPASTVTPYISRFCYVSAMGVAWMAWKMGMIGGTLTTGGGGFIIYRSTDAAGAPTGDAIHVITNNAATTGAAASGGVVNVISNLAGSVTLYTSTNAVWTLQPFGLTTTLYSGNSQVFPAFQYTPIVGITANLGVALLAEIALGSTVVLALIGATTHTFIQVGGGPWAGNTVSGAPSASSVLGAILPWE